MAIKCTHWVVSVVNICLYLCLLTEFTYSHDVPYSINNYDVMSHNLEIAIEEHNIYKRAANNDTSLSDNSTSGSADSTMAPATTASPSPSPSPSPTRTTTTTKVPTPAPTTSSTTKYTTPYPIDEVMDKVNHKYYQSQIFLYSKKNMLYQEVEDMQTHTTLNNNHRVAITVGLPFDFRFYGHSIKNFTIATGGFLYMSPFLHKFLTATQYIAPLMANFDTRLGKDSKIMYKGLSDRFIVEWSNVFLQDQNHTNPFTFQTILHKNGSILFAYKDIPLPIQSISTSNHPVKVGLSDAFYVDTKDGSVRRYNGTAHKYSEPEAVTRRTIYEYHKIKVDIKSIRTNAAVMIDPLLTCNVAKDCKSCVSYSGDFTCKWCESVQRCSSGFDWYHQEWRNANCKDLAHVDLQKCQQTTGEPQTSTVISPITTTVSPVSESSKVSCTDGKAHVDLQKCQQTTGEPQTSTVISPITTTVSPVSESSKVSCTDGKGNLIDRPEGCMNLTTEAPPSLTTITIATTKITTTKQTTDKSVTTQTPSLFKSTTKQASTKLPITTKKHILTTTIRPKITSIENATPNTKSVISGSSTSPPITTTVPVSSVNATALSAKQKCRAFNDKTCPAKSVVPIAGIIVIVVLLLALIGGIGGWVYYAYTHPQSASGMWLMEHRPSQMKSKLATMKFWKKDTGSGEKYRIETEA